MKKTFQTYFLMVILFCFTSSTYAQSDFCKGFEEGWKAIMGDHVFVPVCPFEPFTPVNSTPFREGLKVGMVTAQKAK